MSGENQDLRIAAIFIVLVSSALGVLPTIAKPLSEKTLNSTWFAVIKVRVENACLSAIPSLSLFSLFI
jgi:hypothetical protein